MRYQFNLDSHFDGLPDNLLTSSLSPFGDPPA